MIIFTITAMPVYASGTTIWGNAHISGYAHIHSQHDLASISNLGSRDATTTFFRVKQGGIYVACGCFKGTIDEFESRVKEVHGDNQYGKSYMAAIAYARAVVNQEPVEDENGDEAQG